MTLNFLSSFLFFALSYGINTHKHDGSFAPDAVLRVTSQNISVGGIQRYSSIINESLPGPTLYLPEGKVTWVRVYNDMPEENLTMVILIDHWRNGTDLFSTGTAWRKLHSHSPTVLL